MQTKGIAWTYFINYLKEHYTTAEIEKLIDTLDTECKEFFTKKILVTTWIDYRLLIKIEVIADRILGQGNLDLIRKVNHYQARGEVNGPYKILISLLSPATVIKSGVKLYRQYYDKGKFTVVKLTSQSVIFKLEDAKDIPLYHDVDIESYFAELMRIAGAKNINWTNHKCIAKGDPYCLDEITWE